MDLYNGQIANAPVDETELVYVAVPGNSSLGKRTYGPMSFRPQIRQDSTVALPARDDYALIAIDPDGGLPWLIEWAAITL